DLVVLLVATVDLVAAVGDLDPADLPALVGELSLELGLRLPLGLGNLLALLGVLGEGAGGRGGEDEASEGAERKAVHEGREVEVEGRAATQTSAQRRSRLWYVPVRPITAGSVSPTVSRRCIRCMSMSCRRLRCSSLRTMLSTQKKLARRAPRVTGSTRCTLVPGYRTMSPAASLTAWAP